LLGELQAFQKHDEGKAAVLNNLDTVGSHTNPEKKGVSTLVVVMAAVAIGLAARKALR